MAVQRGLGDDHEVLSRNAFCSGYVDSFGKWNNGFACPSLEDDEVFCCGTTTYRYCCTLVEPEETPGTTTTTNTSGDVKDKVFTDNLPLLLGVTLGALVTVIIVAVIACCLCKAFRKRGGAKPDRLQPVATGTGLSGMYGPPVGSLPRRDVSRLGRHEFDDMMHHEDEVAALSRQTRLSSTTANGYDSLTRTYSSYRAASHRDKTASMTDSVGNTSVSTTTDNERQLFIEHQLSTSVLPSYNFNKLSAGGGGLEDVRPLPPSFMTTPDDDFGSGHYLAGMSPNDDRLYGDNKL